MVKAILECSDRITHVVKTIKKSDKIKMPNKVLCTVNCKGKIVYISLNLINFLFEIIIEVKF